METLDQALGRQVPSIKIMHINSEKNGLVNGVIHTNCQLTQPCSSLSRFADKGKRFSCHHLIPFEEPLRALYGELLYQHFQAGTACSSIMGAAQIFFFQPALPRKAMYAITLHVFTWHSTLA